MERRKPDQAVAAIVLGTISAAGVWLTAIGLGYGWLAASGAAIALWPALMVAFARMQN